MLCTMDKKIALLLLALPVLIGTGCKPLSNSSSTSDRLEDRTRRFLLAALKDQDPLVRVHALESLALLQDSRLIPEIRRHLSDAIPAVRFAAAVALGDLRDLASRNSLQQLVHDQNASVQLAAGYALEKLGDRNFIRWYDNILFSRDEKLAGLACVLLGKLGKTALRKNSEEQLWAVFRMPNQLPTVQLQAAEALARLGDQKILKKLMIFASSIYADDRLLAIEGLRHLGGQDVFAQLSVLAEDPQIEVALAAIGALGTLADKKQIQYARDGLNHQDPEGNTLATRRVRTLAILALGRVGAPADIKRLGDLMTASAPSMHIKIAAARAVIEHLQSVRKNQNLTPLKT